MNLKQIVKNLMSVALMGMIHHGFHGFATCEGMSSSAKLMMNIFRMTLIYVASAVKSHTMIMHLI